MRLIGCHIENFGKLHDLSVDFTEGVNSICKENGWGKSTFAAFIRAMFYGLEGERKRSIDENERKRYTPWQGGVFGGQLTFEVGGKQYTVTRTFSEQEEFELRDAQTNVISNDYGSKLGEELFKVNRESFMRTIFIGQADCETRVTDDVNAKIGNLTENLNDLNSFEAANARLKDILNSLTPTRKTGSISQRKTEITELERKVNVGNGIPNALQNAQEKRQEELQRHNQINTELDVVQKEQIRVSELQAVFAKKEQWENLKRELQNARNKFTGEVPTMEGVDEAQLNFSAMEKASERIATYEMTEGEKKQLASLNMMFDKEVPEEHDIVEQLDKVQRLSSLRTELLKEQVKQAEATKQKSSTLLVGGLGFAIVGVVIAILGAIVELASVITIGVVLGVVGAGVTIAGVLSNKKKSKQEDVVNKAKEERCVKLRADTEALHQSVCVFLEKFGILANEDAFTHHLHELKNQASQYAFLQDKKQKLLRAKNDFEQKHNAILDFFMQYNFEPAHNLQVQLLKIRDDVQAYADANKKLDAFEKKTDISVLNVEVRNENTLSLAELNDKLTILRKERDASAERIAGHNTDLEELQRQFEEWEENKIRLEELNFLQTQEQQKYHHILKVQEYLAKAKENITNRYAAPILESFGKYYEMITTDSAEQFHIDANINITREEQGKQRETNTLSSGYKDLIGICLRVALVDAMYKEESPVLVMDDPFTNLDDEKMKAAKQFLQHVAEKYQVIYFTCSDARK